MTRPEIPRRLPIAADHRATVELRRRTICLLALSGVRVHDGRLAALGMSLPGFVERGRVIASLPSLSLLTLASHTPPGWELTYREADALDSALIDELSRYGVVAISALSARIIEAYRLADALRGEGVLVVLGGLHVSALPDEALAHADAVVQGQGEAAFPRLLEDLAEGRSRGIYDDHAHPFELARARVPRYDLLDPRRYNRLTLQTSRGCPLDCTFCGASRTISRYQRKSIDQIRRELEALCAVWTRPFIELADDNTFVSKKWGRELASLLSEARVRWFTETDISVADDEKLLDALAESGCAQLLIGLESASPQALAGIDSANWKYERAAEVVERVSRIQSRGISVNGCFVIGFDHDDASVFERTYEYARAVDLTEVQITILTPFPGTALHRRLQAEGRLLEPVYWDRCTLFDVTFQPARMSVNELEHGFAGLMERLYSDEEAKHRKRRMRTYLRGAST